MEGLVGRRNSFGFFSDLASNRSKYQRIDTPTKSEIYFQIFEMLKLNYYYYFFVCFSNPTSPPKSPIGSVPCVPFYTLSSPRI